MAADLSDRPTPPRQLTTRTVYQNKWMRVREDTFAQPNGGIGTYSVVDKDDFAVVIAETDGSFYKGFHVFHATDLTVGEHNREASEADMVSALVTEAQFRAMIVDGRIVDAPTIAAYAMLRLFR